MNLRNMHAIVVAMGAAAALVFSSGGCSQNDDPNTSELDNYFESHPSIEDPRSASGQTLSIGPAAALVDKVGNHAVFAVQGGTAPYRWDVSRPSVGTITVSGGTGAEAVYEALVVDPNEIVVSDQNGRAAIAYVSVTTTNALVISAEPDGELEANNQQTVLKVTGGTPPYTWTTADILKGSFIGDNTGTTVIYQRYGIGDNAVTVTDGRGSRTSKVIKQP